MKLTNMLPKKTQTNKKNYIVKAQVIQAIFEIPIHFNIRSSLSNIVDREVINLSSQAYQYFPALRDRGSHDIPSTSCSNETRRCTRWMFAE